MNFRIYNTKVAQSVIMMASFVLGMELSALIPFLTFEPYIQEFTKFTSLNEGMILASLSIGALGT
jgi:hypothetical protein